MADADHVVAAFLLAQHGDHVLRDLVHLLAAGEGHARDLAGVGLGGGLRSIQTEHADLGAAGGGEHGGIVKGQLTVVLHVGSQHGEVGGRHVLLQHLVAVVELVVAQRHGVIAHHVHQLDGGGALGQAYRGGALAEVAGVQHKDVGAVRGILVGQNGDLCIILDCSVDIVGVEDDHRLCCGSVRAHDGLLLTAGAQCKHHGDGEKEGQKLFLHTPIPF